MEIDYQNNSELIGTIDMLREELQKYSFMVLEIRRNEIHLKEQNENLFNELKKNEAARLRSEEAYEQEIDQLKRQVDELKRQAKANIRFSASPTVNTNCFRNSSFHSPLFRRQNSQSFSPKNTVASTPPKSLPKPIRKTTTATQSALKGFISFEIPDFLKLAQQKEFIVYSEPISLAGFRWALRAKGHRKAEGHPKVFGLWLWAKGPLENESQTEWDVTAQMVFRVIRHYSLPTKETADTHGNHNGHIVGFSQPTPFSNRCTIIGFSNLTEIETLSDLREGFLFGVRDCLRVEVDFTVKQTHYILY